MTEHDDMTTPVTRGELREELDHRFEIWTGALLAKLEERFLAIDRRFAAIDHRFAAMERSMVEMEHRLTAEIARVTRSVEESFMGQFRAVDDKYADLPERVTKLEDAVFSPKPRTRRRRAG